MATSSEPGPQDGPLDNAARLAAIHLLSHPSLDQIVAELATSPTAVARVSADPRAYLAAKGIEIPAGVSLSFQPDDPSGAEARVNCRIRILGICLF